MANSVTTQKRPVARETQIVAMRPFMNEDLEVWLGAEVSKTRVTAFIGVSHALLIKSYFLQAADADRAPADIADQVLRLMREKVPLGVLLEFNQLAPELQAWLTRSLGQATGDLPVWARGLMQKVKAGEIDV